MAHKRSEVPGMEKMIQYGRKKFVRYDEGVKIYSMGLRTFQELAKDAGASVNRVISNITEAYNAAETNAAGKIFT